LIWRSEAVASRFISSEKVSVILNFLLYNVKVTYLPTGNSVADPEGSETFGQIRSGTEINVSDSGTATFVRIRIRSEINVSDPDSNPDPKLDPK
jgi:hypothetical protein